MSSGPRCAKTMLALMVRGLCTGLEFPYAQFACKNLKAQDMYRPVTEAIFRLETLELNVRNLTCTLYVWVIL